MNNSLKEFTKSSKGVLILLPKNPYLDQVAAALSLYLTLKEQMTVNIACPSPMLVEYNRLIGINKIVTQIGDKNLVIRFKNYQAQDIERVTYDVEDNEFKLSVIPRPDVAAPNEDQVSISYSGVSADTVILVGGGNESHFPDLANEKFVSAKIAHIGKQDVASTSKKNISSFTKQKASVSEIIAEIIKEFSEKFNEDVASNLLAGMREGSRDFSHTSVDASTFELAAELIRAGGRQEATVSTKPQKPRFSPQAPAPTPIQIQKPPMVNNKPADAPDSPSASSETRAPASWLEPKIFKGASEK